MDTNYSYESEFDCPAIYEITVRGEIGSACLSSIYGIEEMTLTYHIKEDDSINTILTGLLADQAALNGVLNAIRLSQLKIVSVLKAGDCL